MASLPRASLVCALAVALTGSVFAQAPGQTKKAPNQVVQTGHNDAPTDPQTGRAREATPEETAALEAALQQFGKRAEGATFTYFDNGMVRAELDDSFMEAMTVTVMPDGSLKYGHAPTGTQNPAVKTGETTGKTGERALATPAKKKPAEVNPQVPEDKE